MSSKLRYVFLAIEAIILFVLSMILFHVFQLKSGLYVFSLPMDGLGKLLRFLSLSGDTGNIFAWGIYLMIIIIPIVYLLYRIKKRAFSLVDILLPFLSAYIGYMLYIFINPFHKIYSIETGFRDLALLPILKMGLSFIFYSFLFAYVVLRIYKRWNLKHEINLYSVSITLLMLASGIYVAYGAFFMTFIILTELSMYSILKYILIVLPIIFIINIFLKGCNLISSLKLDFYSNTTVSRAHKLAIACKWEVIICAFSSLLTNLLTLAFSSTLKNVNYTLTFPILPLILSFAFFILANYFSKSVKISEENDLFV